MFPYPCRTEILKDTLNNNSLQQVLFNLPAGNWEEGERGVAVQPDRIQEFRDGVNLALDYAWSLSVDRINCLVGQRVNHLPHQEQWNTLVENLQYAASELAKSNKILLIEPINTFDMPGFFLSSTQEALQLIADVGADNFKLQYDVYHMQKMEGNVTETILNNLSHIGHIQIADNPGRHQPGTGEINFPFLLRELDAAGYEHYVGLEYIPKPDTLSSLAWVEEWNLTL
jgi:hydroxypyruvate isomerase